MRGQERARLSHDAILKVRVSHLRRPRHRLATLVEIDAGLAQGRGTDGRRDSSKLVDTGEQGEVTEMHVNSYKPIVTNTLSIIAGTRPAVKPVATNGDSTSAAQTRLALGVHEFYDRKVDSQRLETE